MGFDYSFRLYFPRQSLWSVLVSVAALAVDAEKRIRFLSLEREITLPFEPCAGTDNVIDCEDARPEWNFIGSLNFDLDNPIREYLDQHDGWPSQSSRVSVPNQDAASATIGYIYMTIYKGPKIPLVEPPDNDLIMMEFDAATTDMSLLFNDSKSIRKTFVNLLEKNKGICGLLKREGDGVVFWWKGEEKDLMVPLSWISLREIEIFLTKGQLPFKG